MSLSPWLTLSVIGRTPVYIITLLIFVALQIPAALTSNFVRSHHRRVPDILRAVCSRRGSSAAFSVLQCSRQAARRSRTSSARSRAATLSVRRLCSPDVLTLAAVWGMAAVASVSSRRGPADKSQRSDTRSSRRRLRLAGPRLALVDLAADDGALRLPSTTRADVAGHRRRAHHPSVRPARLVGALTTQR